jgi:hypothetical protein
MQKSINISFNTNNQISLSFSQSLFLSFFLTNKSLLHWLVITILIVILIQHYPLSTDN